jgi:two-component system sensor histidine kinase KdpD
VVQNAVRYAPPGEPVRVVGAAADGLLHLRVIDRGPGIAPAERERVFQPFQRSSDARPARPEAGGGAGAGLGLAVAKGFLTAMGGTISVEDTPGGGTTMVIGLPTVEAGE